MGELQQTPFRAARQDSWPDALAAVAEDLAGEFRLEPLLERILRSAVDLLGCRSGSLTLIDAAAHTYLKRIDLEEGCQTGQVFSLDDGRCLDDPSVRLPVYDVRVWAGVVQVHSHLTGAHTDAGPTTDAELS